MKHISSEAWPNGFQMRCVLQLSQLIQLCLGLWLLWGSRNSRFSWHERMLFLHSRAELTLQNSPKLLQHAARGIKMTACSISEHAAPHTCMLEANDWGHKKREESGMYSTDRGSVQTELHAILSFLHVEVITKLNIYVVSRDDLTCSTILVSKFAEALCLHSFTTGQIWKS